MYHKVVNVNDEYVEECAGVPAWLTNVNKLKTIVSDIELVTQQQTETGSKGVTKDKRLSIDRLVELSLKIANSLYVFAFDTTDNPLLVKVNVNKCMFYQNHDRNALTLAKIIAAEAKNHSEALSDYGISAADITELDSIISQLEGSLNAPASVIDEHKLYTSNLKALFVAADSIIYDKLDKLVRLFKTSSPDFFNLYSNARNVVNTAARKRKDTAAE
jgi:hypothetical protein